MHATSSSCNKVIYTETEIASRFTFSLLVLFVSFVYSIHFNTGEPFKHMCSYANKNCYDIDVPRLDCTSIEL